MVELSRADLHVSVSDPVATSMNFLNEIAGRYPDAISLAAGRPYDGFYSTEDVQRYLGSYVDHLRAGGLSEERVRGRLLQYGRTNGQLGSLIATMLEIDEGIVVPPDSVMVTAGCQEAMIIALRALCPGPDDVVLVAEPCYVGLTGAARILGVDVVPVPESSAGLDPETVAAVAREVRAAGKRPRALYLVPNFSNPSGISLPVATRRRLLDVAGEQDLLLLEDDPYGLFGLDDEPRPALKSLDTEQRVLYLGSFAKSCFPGARVGFLVADQTVVGTDGTRTLLADEMSAVKSMLTVNTSPISQAVIGGVLIESGCSLRVANRDKVAFYRNNLRTMLTALDEHFPAAKRGEGGGVRWNVPRGGFFAVVDLPFEADEKLLQLSAEQFGVLWTPMRFFYSDGGTHSVRLSCSYLEPEQIAEGVHRLSRLVAANA